eukprot:scaffold75877_cov20-Tisochrysis_lutea.AAC.1
MPEHSCLLKHAHLSLDAPVSWAFSIPLSIENNNIMTQENNRINNAVELQCIESALDQPNSAWNVHVPMCVYDPIPGHWRMGCTNLDVRILG